MLKLVHICLEEIKPIKQENQEIHVSGRPFI
jgi:hypothetical protein